MKKSGIKFFQIFVMVTRL